MFSGCTVPPDIKETEFGSREKQASPSAGTNTRVVLGAMFAHTSASLQLFPEVRIFLRSLGVIYYDGCVLSEGH